MNPALNLQGAEKRFPGFHLGPLDLELQPGTVLALVGPNGAGKTTILDLLSGITRPSRGAVEVLGHRSDGSDASWKSSVGYVTERQAFYEGWTVAANLVLLAGLVPTWSSVRQAQLAQRFGLPMEKKVRTLSKGNRSKLSLVAALARQPRLLLLDEPSSGLDPLMRADLLETLWDLVESGEHTIVYATHVLSEVSRLADEVIFVQEGQLLLRARRDELEAAWRRVGFRLRGATLPKPLTATLIDHRQEGDLHQAVTTDFALASSLLAALGATEVETQALDLDEIAVHVLRGRGVVQRAYTTTRDTHA